MESGESMDQNKDYGVATFAGGCFWCTEADFEKVPGVLKVVSGYTGGRTKNPTYKEVCSGGTGHLEAVQVHFDPQRVTYEALLEHFWRHVDPTDAGGQFVDRGEQYQSAIFYHDEGQRDGQEGNQQRFEQELAPELAPGSTHHLTDTDLTDTASGASRGHVDVIDARKCHDQQADGSEQGEVPGFPLHRIVIRCTGVQMDIRHRLKRIGSQRTRVVRYVLPGEVCGQLIRCGIRLQDDKDIASD